jgi:hypothetical protein
MILKVVSVLSCATKKCKSETFPLTLCLLHLNEFDDVFSLTKRNITTQGDTNVQLLN